jgi:hypothetical protein
MVMTEAPRDAIGLSDRLRDVEAAERRVAGDCDCRPEDTANWQYADTCREAATALDALSARVKELTDLLATGEDLRRQVKDVAEQWQARATRAEQQRDEAYERLKPFSDAAESIDESHLDRMDIWESPSGLEITAGHLRAARDLVRRLAAGTEKEGE